MSTTATLFGKPVTPYGLDECAGCDCPVVEPLIEDGSGAWMAYCDACAAKRKAPYVRLPERTQALLRGA